LTDQFSYDLVVVGGGLAGLMAAYRASRHSELKIALVSKVHPLRSHTIEATGAVNLAIPRLNKEDSWELNGFDTVKGSDYLADQDAVEILCQEGPEAFVELANLGACITRDQKGRMYPDFQAKGGAASVPRVYNVILNTARLWMRPLYEFLIEQANATFFDEYRLLSLATDGDACCGVIVMNVAKGEVVGLSAKAVLLATGGLGWIYGHTTNARICTGDGIAVAYRAGVPYKDPEFVQFHPTSLYGTDILMTEICRAAGGYLYNSKNERFMKRYAPQFMERAARDVVARGILTEIVEGRGFEYDAESGTGYVLLDLRHLKREQIEMLHQVNDFTQRYRGINIATDLIPVIPAQHFTMGGIAADVSGRTKVKGLYAAGECACISVHGANRLGANALVECAVFGKRAGEEAAKYALSAATHQIPNDQLEKSEDEITQMLTGKGSVEPLNIEKRLKDAMWLDVGLFRDASRLQRARSTIKELKRQYENVRVQDSSRIFNTVLGKVLELRNMLDLAEAIVIGALARQESRGSHHRFDFPERDDAHFLSHTLITYDETEPRLSYEPVRITRWQPAERKY
jgi:succinate dehydrogenase/fumarate reductase flavoprotein subunit